MRLHQILCSSVNQFNNKPVFCAGQISKYIFFAYGSNNQIIIIDRNLFQIQVIEVMDKNDENITCIKCNDMDGKIVSAYSSVVCIFYPRENQKEDESIYTWKRLWEFDTDATINQIAINSYSDGILVSSGNNLFYYKIEGSDNPEHAKYHLHWKFMDSSPSHIIEFSTDELYFATSNNEECFVKIWYPSKKAWLSNNCFQYLSNYINNKLTEIYDLELYSMIYLPHPRPVTSFSWRRKSPFCNSDIILNVLLTSCKDGVARIWGENLWDLNSQSVIGISSVEDLIKLPMNHSINLSDGLLKRISPYVSFHTIVSINHTSSFKTIYKDSKKHNACLDFFWLNNKETEVTCYTNTVFGKNSKSTSIKRSTSNGSMLSEQENKSEANISVEFNLELYNRALAQWHKGPDIIFSVSAIDGSFLTWSIDYLDSVGIDQAHSPSASFLTSIAMAIPLKLAKTVSNCFVFHDSEAIAHLGLRHRRYRAESMASIRNISSVSQTNENPINVYQNLYHDLLLNQSTLLLTVHGNGSVNSWKIEYSDRKSFSSVYNISKISHVQDFSYHVLAVTLHPYLPLLLISSVQKSYTKEKNEIDSIDISVWQLLPVLSSYFSNKWSTRASLKLVGSCKYIHTAWIPLVLNFSLTALSFFCVSTSIGIHVFQLLPQVNEACEEEALDSSFHPILSVFGLKMCGILNDSNNDYLVSFLHSFRLNNYNHVEPSSSCPCSNDSTYIVVAIENTSVNPTYLHVWEVIPTFENLHLQNRFYVSKSLSGSSNSDLRGLSLGQVLSEYIKKFEINFDKEDLVHYWKANTDTPTSTFTNYYCNTNLVVLSGLSKLGILKFIEMTFFFNNRVINDHKSPYPDLAPPSAQTGQLKKILFDVKISLEKSCYSSLSTILQQFLYEEKPISISYANFTLLSYIGVPLNNTEKGAKYMVQNIFIVRIFENRLAGENSWKQEACFHIPFSDIGLTTELYQQINLNSVGIFQSWCSLDNGNYLLSICIFGKIFIIAPCLSKSYYLYSDSIKLEFGGSSDWNILSTYNYSQNVNHAYNSYWNWGGLFLLSSTLDIRVYSPIGESPVNNINEAGLVSSEIYNEVTQALSKYGNKLQIEPLNIMGLIILGKFQLAMKIIFNFCHQLMELVKPKNIKSTDLLSIKSLSSETSEIKEVYRSPEREKASISFLKLNQIFEFLFDSNKLDMNSNCLLESSITETTSTKFSTGSQSEKCDEVPTVNKRLVNRIKKCLSKIDVEGLEDVDLNLLYCLFYVCAEFQETVFSNTTVCSLDECAIQYLIAAKLYLCLLKKSKEDSKHYLLDYNVLTNVNYVWALHSNSQDEICERLGIFSDQVQLTWALASVLGLGWWVSSTTAKKKIIETIAKCEYQQKKDPLDSALFYLLLQRKNVISALYKSQKNSKMYDFFTQDFSNSASQSTCLKNAYYLLGLHRFTHSIALFLLVGRYWDAVSISVSNLKDYQLGFMICQTCNNFNNEDILSKFIKTYIIGEVEGYSQESDPFLRSLGFWALDRPIEALTTIVDKVGRVNVSKNDMGKKQFDFQILVRFHQLQFFNYLKSNLKIKKYFTYQEQGIKPTIKHLGADVTPLYIASSYDRLLCSTIRHSLNSGSPLISLILSIGHKLVNIYEDNGYGKDIKTFDGITPISSRLTSGQFVTQPSALHQASLIDWSRPMFAVTELNKDIDNLCFDQELYEDKVAKISRKNSTEDIEDSSSNLCAAALIRIQTFRHIRFSAFIRNLIEDTKNWESSHNYFNVSTAQNSDLLMIVYKNLRIFELCCSKNIFETLYDSQVLHMNLASINDANISYYDLYSFLNKYHFIIIILIRHFCLYNFVHARIVIELIIILSETEAFSIKQLTRNVNLAFLHYSNLPILVSPLPGKSPLTDILTYISSFSELIVEELIKLDQALFFFDIDSPDYKNISKKINVLLDLASNLSHAVFRGLGGNQMHPLLLLLSKSKAEYVACRDRSGNVVPLSSEAEMLFDHVLITSTPQTWPGPYFQQDGPEIQQFSSLVLVMEVYITCLTLLLIQAIFEKNAKLCNSLLNKDQTLYEDWNSLFGGSASIVYDPEVLSYSQSLLTSKSETSEDSLREHVQQSNLKIKNIRFSSLGLTSSQQSSIPLGKLQTEIFVAPTIKILDSLLGKVNCKQNSNKCLSSHDDDDLISDEIHPDESYSNIYSYAWLIMTTTLLNNQAFQIKQILQKSNFSTSRIFSFSPLIHSILTFLNKLRFTTLSKLESYENPPPDFIVDQSFCYHSCNSSSPSTALSSSVAILQRFIDPKNTPFQSLKHKEDANLWNRLVCCDHLQNAMLLFSFPLTKTITQKTYKNDDSVLQVPNKTDKSYATIFSSNEGVSNFCFDHTNPTSFAVATPSELCEIKIAYGSLASVTDLDFNLETYNHVSLTLFLEDMKLLPQSSSTGFGKQSDSLTAHPISTPIIISKSMLHTSSSTNLLESHPSEPYYVASTYESKVCLYQYGLKESLHTFYNCQSKNPNSKVVQIMFNDYGSKFGIMDDGGGLSLCLFNTHSSNEPYLQLDCHNKFGSGFTFLGSSSLIATVGHSADGLDVALWDTLLPKRSKLTCSFQSHEHGCNSVAYVPGIQALVIGGRKGALFIYDLRKGKMLQSISQAHDAAIKCMAIDNNIVATGSADGIVNVWNINKNEKPLELYKTYSDCFNAYSARSYPSQVTCVRLSGRYLFTSSSEGTLTLRNIDHEII